jgi:hypothetical protein
LVIRDVQEDAYKYALTGTIRATINCLDRRGAFTALRIEAEFLRDNVPMAKGADVWYVLNVDRAGEVDSLCVYMARGDLHN